MDGSLNQRLSLIHSLGQLNDASNELWFDFVSSFFMLDTRRSKEWKLGFLSGTMNWQNQCLRYKLMTTMLIYYHGVSDDQLPNLLSICSRRRIERLLCDAINRMCGDEGNKIVGKQFVIFVVRSGYKHEPDASGDSVVHHTLVHYAIDKKQRSCVKLLFRIFDNCDANYEDGAGLTHLHAACMVADCEDVAARLLARGGAKLDLNRIWPRHGDAPLHLALYDYRERLAEMLLRAGADPNLANVDGQTALHIICDTEHYDAAEMFFRVNEELGQVVLVDAVDAKGRTPLQLAVAKLFPELVKMLLDKGANLATFVFPNGYLISKTFEEMENDPNTPQWKIKAAACLLVCVDMLEKRGYELTESDILIIMKLFDQEEMFEKPEDRLAHPDNYSDEFMAQARTIREGDTSLYDLLVMENVDRERFSYEDFKDLAFDDSFRDLPQEFMETCSRHLVEKLSRRYFVKWSEEDIYLLLKEQLLIELCGKVLDLLSNEDIYNVCLAAKQQRDEMEEACKKLPRHQRDQVKEACEKLAKRERAARKTWREGTRRSQRTRRAPDRLQVGQ